jgi:hypothetical protein
MNKNVCAALISKIDRMIDTSDPLDPTANEELQTNYFRYQTVTFLR